MAASSVSPLFGAVELCCVEERNKSIHARDGPKIAYITAGNRDDPCVVVPPGGQATKEETLFWARELAALGPFFVVMYDLRGTGGSNDMQGSIYWDSILKIFDDAGTTPIKEMERVLGVVNKDNKKVDSGGQHADSESNHVEQEAEQAQRQPQEQPDNPQGPDNSGAGGLELVRSKKHSPGVLNPAISNRLPDFRGYVEDGISVLNELNIQKAHFCGLSQGGVLARLAATMYPERVISCISAGSAADKLGVMMGAMSAGAEEFYDLVKAKKLYTKAGKMSLDGETPLDPGCDGGRQSGKYVTKNDYVQWRKEMLKAVAPGFGDELYEEMAGRSYDSGAKFSRPGYMTEEQVALPVLAYEAWERAGGAQEHLQKLKTNLVPMMFVHGRRDPVVHFGELQKLFSVTKNCVQEAHEHGHNFGPPEHQRALLAKMARFMNNAAKSAAAGVNASTAGAIPAAGAGVNSAGADTWASAGVSADLVKNITANATIPAIYDAFCYAQTAVDTEHCFGVLVEKLGLQHLRDGGTDAAAKDGTTKDPPGLPLFLGLHKALDGAGGLNFRQKKLMKDLHAALLKAHKVVAKARRGTNGPLDAKAVLEVLQETTDRCTSAVNGKTSGSAEKNDVLVCGAGPVGLRAAVELALLGFRVRVVEKRPNFSRANILTFWDETMSDMLALGAKSYYPNLQPTGKQKILGTRQIQVCLLKSLLLLGGEVRYGQEICGLMPPAATGESGNGAESSNGKWRAQFRPYERHRRTKEAKPQQQGEVAPATEAETTAEAATAEETNATLFQKAKDYGGKETAITEEWDVDEDFISGSIKTADKNAAASPQTQVAFDFYIVAEGGWSDSTQKLGFSKKVDHFKPVFGLVANLQYDETDLKEKNMTSQIHFCLGQGWPLARCPIQAEFIEYLKGETHFFAMVVSKKNYHKDQTDNHLARMKEEDRAHIPDELIAEMRRAAQQKGLVEMGVFKENLATGKACLQPANVDMGKLTEMVRCIVQEMGLPDSTPFCETNPIQLFDFSRRARCIEPVRVLRSSSNGNSVTSQENSDREKSPDCKKQRVLGGAEYCSSQATSNDGASNHVDALLLPVGDALQEPIWTQGLGINRGFHTAMNQAYVCLLAREKGFVAATKEASKIHDSVLKMKWGMGHSGLAGSGSGDIGLKPYKEWDTDPKNRLAYK